MEPEQRRGVIEDTIQPRHADGNAPLVVESNQAETPEPESAEASASNMMKESLQSGPGYLVQDSVDLRNPYQTSLSSPPTQNMVHDVGYDPNRIPSSIFTDDTSTSPMDWSTGSTESLFSIHMENNSFSGYQGVFKSGELGIIEEMNSLQNPFETFEAKANEGSHFPSNLPALPETIPEHETQSENIEEDIRIQKGNSQKSTAITEESKKNHENKAYYQEETKPASSISPRKGGVSPFERTNSIQNRLSHESSQSYSSKNRLSNGSTKSSSSKNRLSDESGKSCSSFAFPVLVTDSRKSSSFRLKTDKKAASKKKQEEPKRKQEEPKRKQEEPKRKQEAEPPKPVTKAAKRRCCLCSLPGWLKCC